MALGIDIVQISRIKDVDLFSKGILSNKEMEIFLTRNKKAEFLAGRFAAKEAFSKAKKMGLKIPLKDIEILYKENGSPYILYKEEEFDVSISHDGDYAIAVVNIL